MRKKTNEEFLNEVYDLVQDEYTFLEEYKTNKTKIKVKHNVCDNIYEVQPSSFLNGHGCPYCARLFKAKKQVKTNEQFLKEVYDLVGNEYVFLEPYQGNKTKIRVKHNKCGDTFEMRPNNFLLGQRCPYCYGNAKKTNGDFLKEVYNLVGDEYTFLEEYVNNRTKLRVRHNKCGSIYEVTPKDFLNKHGCPYCYQKGSSHGNETIAKYLDNNHISYQREYKFKDCIYKRPLPFDFYLKEYNTCIEFDGEQHYSPNDFFEEHDPFKERQIKDNIKSKYCYDKGIKLIRIPYTKKNSIDKILDEVLYEKKD